MVGLEPRRTDLARGIVIARSTQPLDDAGQRDLLAAFEQAGISEGPDDPGGADVLRVWHAAPWLPPTSEEIDAQRAALADIATRFELDAVWFVKVETAIDGVAWLELVAQERGEDDDDGDDEGEAREEVDAIFEESEQVLYAAPDAPAEGAVPEATIEDADESSEVKTIVLESQWRSG